MLKALRRSKQVKEAARQLCGDLTAQARAPVFFTELGVPDTMDGRFDLVTLHAWLALERLRSDPALAQALVDQIFLQFEEALRDLGTGDVGMDRRLKTMAGAFYGRLEAYRRALNLRDLPQAIWRNVYRSAPERQREANALATWAMACRSHLATLGDVNNNLDFGPLPNI